MWLLLSLYSDIEMLGLITSENIPCVHFLFHIIQASVITIGYNGLALCFESVQVFYHLAAEESTAIFQGWFINNHFRTFGFHPFHDTLNRRLAEVIAVRLHR